MEFRCCQAGKNSASDEKCIEDFTGYSVYISHTSAQAYLPKAQSHFLNASFVHPKGSTDPLNFITR
jgi:hypothetical protein